MGKYLEYGRAIAAGGEKAAKAKELDDEEYKNELEKTTELLSQKFAQMDKENEDSQSTLKKVGNWAMSALGSQLVPENKPPVGADPAEIQRIQGIAQANVAAEEAAMKAAQEKANQEAVTVMNELTVLPESLKPLANTEFGRAFMVGQAQNMYGDLSYKQMQYALKDKSLSDEELSRLSKLEKVSKYKSPEEGFFNFVKNSAAELVGQQVQIATDPEHNPYVTGATAGLLTAAGSAALGPGAIATGAVAAGAAGMAASLDNTARKEAGHAFAELRSLKHADGSDVSVREAAIASQLIGGAVGLIDTAGLGVVAKNIPVLSKFMGTKNLISNPTVRSAILSAVKRMGKATAAESISEGMQEIPGIIAGAIVQDKDVLETLKDPESAKQVIEVIKKTAAGMGALTGAGNIRSVVKDARQIRADQRAALFETAKKDVKESEGKSATTKVDSKKEVAPPAEKVAAAAGVELPTKEEVVPAPEIKEEVASAGPVVDEGAGPVSKEELPKIRTGSRKDKKTGEIVPTFINVDPISTPGMVAEKADGSISAPLMPPENMSPRVKMQLLSEEDQGYPSQLHDDGTRIHMPKRVVGIQNANSLSLDMTARPAILSIHNEIIEGPPVNPIAISRPIIEDYDSLIESRHKAEAAFIRLGNRLEATDEGPSEVKDTGFVITGPEGSPVAGQAVWVSSKLMDEKFKGAFASLEERVRAAMGDKYEKSLQAKEAVASAKVEEKNKPMSPEETAFVGQKYIKTHQKRVVASLANSGMDRNELESIVQETTVDAARAVLAGKVRTPVAQQRAFLQQLRGRTAKAYEKSFGMTGTERATQRKEGTQNVSLEKSGLENTDVTGVGETMQNAAVEGATGEAVASAVKPNSPIKQAQSRGESLEAGKKKPPIRTKVFTEEEKAAEAAKRGLGVTQSKVGPHIPANIRSVRARQSVNQKEGPSETQGKEIVQKATPTIPVEKIVEPKVSGKEQVRQILQNEEKKIEEERKERRDRNYVPQDKKSVDGQRTAEPKLVDQTIGELRRDDKLYIRKNGDSTFAMFQTANAKAKELGGTVLATSKGTYVVSTENVKRVEHTMSAVRAHEMAREIKDKEMGVKKKVPTKISLQQSKKETVSGGTMLGESEANATLPAEATKAVEEDDKTYTKVSVPVSKEEDAPIQLQTAPSHARVSDVDLGDKITSSGKPSIYQAVVVNPATSGVMETFESIKGGNDGFIEVGKKAQEASKKITQAHRVVITQSENPTTPSNSHFVLKVVDKGFNPAKRIMNEKGEVVIPQHLVAGGAKLMGSLHKAFSWADRALDVESKWKRSGMGEIGFTIKNFFSRRDVEEKLGMAKAIEMQKHITNTFPNPSRQNYIDIILAAESPVHMKEWSDEYKLQIAPLAAELRKYFDDSQDEMSRRGLKMDFKERMIATQQGKLDNEVDPIKRQKIMEAIDLLRVSEFVHIPYKMIFASKINDMIETTDPIIRKKRYAELRSMMDVKRNVTTIHAMFNKKNKAGEFIIDRSELTPVNIIMNYAYNKGHDHAMLDIRDAIMQYKKIFKITKTKPHDDKNGYTWIKVNTPKLNILSSALTKEQRADKKHLWIRQDAVRAITEALGYQDKQTKWDKFMAISKMTAFSNPVILPLYNTLQGIRGWTINPFHPIRTWQSFIKAIDDIGGLKTIVSKQNDGYSTDYIEALRNGLESKPFSSPFAGWREYAKALSDGTNGHWTSDWFRAIKAEFEHSSPLAKYTIALPVIKSMYQASWHTAWAIDGLYRMQAYNYLKNYGHSSREAAQVAANLQGDYASVPPKTRKILNKVFFTPTFKIATMKLYGTLLKDAMKVSYNMAVHPTTWKDRTTMTQRRYAAAAVGVYAVNLAFDMALIGIGFERDTFGRRYVKRVHTEDGAKDFTITFASSENIIQRFLERYRKSFADPSVSNPYTQFLYMNRWELHPVYRNAYSAVTGDGDEGRVWSRFDSLPTAAAKATWYFTAKTYNVLDSIQSVTEFSASKLEREKVNKTWVKEYGKGLGVIYNGLEKTFGYAYLQDPVEKRKVFKLKQIQKEFIKEAYESIEKTGEVSPNLKESFHKRMENTKSHYEKLKEGVVK